MAADNSTNVDVDVDDELFKDFQHNIHLQEGKLPHIFIVLGASVSV